MYEIAISTLTILSIGSWGIYIWYKKEEHDARVYVPYRKIRK